MNEVIGVVIIGLFFVVPVVLMYLGMDEYDKCYSKMEHSGDTVFGCCSGNDSLRCSECPHYVNLEEK